MENLVKVKALMKEQGISMNDLIEKTGIKKRTLYYIFENEDNFRKTKVENIIAIMKILNKEIQQDIFQTLQEDYLTSMLNKNIAVKEFISKHIACLHRLSEKDLNTLSLMIHSMVESNNEVKNNTEN